MRHPEKQFSIATLPELGAVNCKNGWQVGLNLQSGRSIDTVTSISAYNPYVSTLITFTPELGWQITEGYQPTSEDTQGNMGVTIMGVGHPLHGQGWELAAVSKSRNHQSVAASVLTQTRNTVDAQGATVGNIRGFATPVMPARLSAVNESFEESGLRINEKKVVEIGREVNVNPALMPTRRHGGANSFRVLFSRKLLEEGEGTLSGASSYWQLKHGVFQPGEAPDKAFEGIAASFFVDVPEIIRQQLWTGTTDIYTLITTSRTFLKEYHLDFTDYWSRLVAPKQKTQDHSRYPIKPLTSENHHQLIGKKPGWQVTINGEPQKLSALWAYQPSTGLEVAFGHRHEATDYDGFVFQFNHGVIMPVVEIDGELFVGGIVNKHPHNIAETNIFQAVQFKPTEYSVSSDSAQSILVEAMGINRVETDGVIRRLAQSGGPVNPNSAHGTGVIIPPFFADISPAAVYLDDKGNYRLKNGNPNFIFVPLKKAINNTPDGPTVAAAATLCASAKVVKVR